MKHAIPPAHVAAAAVIALASAAPTAAENSPALDSRPEVLRIAQAITDRFVEKPPATGAARTAIEFGGTHETLTNNLPDWSSVYLEAAHDFGPRHTLYGGVRETRRFGATDTQVNAGLYYPFGEKWTLQVEGDFSGTHNVLPNYSLYANLHRTLAHGWGAGAGARRSEYTTTPVNILSGLLERYWGNFRGAYTIYNGRPEGAPSATAHRFQLNYYYGERSTVGLSYTTGREVESVGPPAGIIASDITDWTLTGRHWFARHWAVTYDLLTHKQGSLYRREGMRFGIRHSF